MYGDCVISYAARASSWPGANCFFYCVSLIKVALSAGKDTALDTYINPNCALAETVRKTLFSYQRDGGGTRSCTQV